jgi:hypothetical protein
VADHLGQHAQQRDTLHGLAQAHLVGLHGGGGARNGGGHKRQAGGSTSGKQHDSSMQQEIRESTCGGRQLPERSIASLPIPEGPWFEHREPK